MVKVQKLFNGSGTSCHISRELEISMAKLETGYSYRQAQNTKLGMRWR